MNSYTSFILDPLSDALKRFATHLPQMAAAIVLLLIGIFVARALRTLVEKMFDKAHLDEYTSRVGINEVFSHLGFGKSPSYAFSFLVYWFILFVFIVSAANAVNMTVVSDLLERFALFLPTLAASILILFGGLLFARFLATLVANAATSNGISGGGFLSQGAYMIVLLFAAMTALEQLGLKMELLTVAIEIVFASLGLAAAIAFGLGGKEVAAELIRDSIKKSKV
jgi:hypothetical protein